MKRKRSDLSKVKSSVTQNILQELVDSVNYLTRIVRRIFFKLFPDESSAFLSAALPKLPIKTQEELQELENFIENESNFGRMVR